jgi:hypothetical protein
MMWPRLETGALDMTSKTFHNMTLLYPQLTPLHELRETLSDLRLADLTVGRDNRNRAALMPFNTITGRNAPSTAKFIFGPARWVRGLIRPPAGMSLALLDFKQQEFGISAVLANDANMLAAYRSSDPYLHLAKLAGAVPSDATEASHPVERKLYKVVTLALNYGRGEQSLAAQICRPPSTARDLIRDHRQFFRRYWTWIEGVVEYAQLHGQLWTVFDWRRAVTPKVTPDEITDISTPSLLNWPAQSHGSEVLRLACCLATERGVTVAAPIHDALLILAPTSTIEAAVATTQKAMREASAIVLNGFELNVDTKLLVHAPDRFMEEDGLPLWTTVTRRLDNRATHAGGGPDMKPEVARK